MNNRLAGWVAGVCVASAVLGASVASARDRSKQSKNAPPAANDQTVPADVSDPEAYQRELKAAQEQRDRDLRDAERETDRRTFEKRKAAIFAQYAAVLTEMNERYRSAGPEVTTPPERSTRTKRSQTPPPPERRGVADTKKKPAPKEVAPKEVEAGPDLAEIQKQLDDENARHEMAMADLNQQLKDAQASGVKRQIRVAERAIDKENSDYQAKKTQLEQQLKELGGGERETSRGKPAKKARK